MSTCPSPDRLRQFLGDKLSGPEEAALAGHVEGCQACQDHLEALTQLARPAGRRSGVAGTDAGLSPPAFLSRLRQLPVTVEGAASNRDTRVDAVTMNQQAGGTEPWPAVPGYEILGELGRGGMGVVYQARQVALGRVVALKMVLNAAHAGAEQVARFRREAEAVARLQHPNIIQVHDVDEQDGRPFFSMEYVAGGTLAGLLAGTPQEPRAAASFLRTLALAVDAAHQRGIVHRDLKPANILLSLSREPQVTGPLPAVGSDSPLREAVPKITDFGLAKQVPTPGSAEASAMTQSGAILGSPSYMAPEQASGQGQTAGPTADIYSLGAILYELLTGRPPFKGVTPLATLMQVTHDEPVPPRRLVPGVPRDLETICLKCLEKTPARRYPRAAALADDLGRFLAGESIQARPAAVWERAFKWARRQPALASLILVCLTAFVGLTLAWQRAERQRVAALDQLQHSITLTFDQLVQIGKFYRADNTEMAYHRALAIKNAITFFTTVLQENRTSTERVRRLLGQAHYGLGLSYLLAGDSRTAERHYRDARAAQETLTEEFPAQAEYRVDLALTQLALTEAYLALGRKADAEASTGKALALFTELPTDHPRLAVHAMGVARELFNQGKLADAIPWQGRAIAQLETLAKESQSPEVQKLARQSLIAALFTRALSLMHLGRSGDALADWDRSIELADGIEAVRGRLFRAQALAMMGDHARAVAALKEIIGRGWLDGAALTVAGIGGPLAGVATSVLGDSRVAVLKDEKLPSAERAQRAEEYTVLFLGLLIKARDAGLFKDPKYREQLRQEPALEFLRGRADFREFLKSLED